MSQNPNTHLIDISEASRIIGVSVDTLRRYDREGKLTATRLVHNGKRMYKKENIDKFLEGKK